MTFQEMALSRYSARAFQNKPVDQKSIDRILATARTAPTAANAQPYHIWVLQSPEARETLSQATKDTFGAPAFLLLGVRPQDAWTRKDDRHNFADVDGGIIGAHILFAVCGEGLATTWVGRVDPAPLKKAFPEMAEYDLIGLFPIGYAADEGAGTPGAAHFARKALAEISSAI